MKKNFYFLAGLATVLFFASCEKENLELEEIPQNCNVVEVNENITSPTVWTEGNVYVINKRNLSIRSVLTIEPGVTVKLNDARVDVIDGKILAEGTAQKRIVFTSLADDRYCGDSNGDLTATQPEKGDWRGINLQGGTGHLFRYVDIFYAGQNSGGFYNAVKVGASSFEFDHCHIAHTFYNPLASFENSTAFHGGSNMVDPNTSKFTNNSLYDNGRPLYTDVFYTVNSNNRFHNPENPQQTNSHNGISLYYNSGGAGATVNWHITEVPYIVDDWVQIHNSSTLNIGANVVVKFKRQSAGIQRGEPQNVNLHATAILTSYKDDSVKGDTNGDGNMSSPAPGDWRGFYNLFGGTPYYEVSPNIRYAANP